MISVHIAGVGMTQFGRSSNTLVEIMRAAANECASAFKDPRFRCYLHFSDESRKYTGDANIAHMSPKRSDSEESRR